MAKPSLVTLLLLAACTQSHQLVDGSPDLVASYCRYVARCNDLAFAGLGGSIDRCIERVSQPECRGHDLARLAVSGPEADACAKALTDASCRHLGASGSVDPDLCERAEAQPAAEGRSCLDTICDEGLYCDGDPDCPTCKRLLPEGADCDESTERHRCEPGLLCLEGTCRPYLVAGEPCESSFDCASHLCEDGRCIAPAALGAQCERARECASRRCSDEGVCVDTPDGRLNDPCSEDSQCRGFLECVGGRCVGSTTNCPGSSTSGCDCSESQVCVPESGAESGVCVDRLPAGAACANQNVPCALQHLCSPETGLCVPLPREGEFCYGVWFCATGAYCDDTDYMCKRAKPDGEACASATQCQNARCTQGRCGPPVCPP